MSSQPKFLILGGLGFVGRNLVKYIIDKKLASKIRVADKAIPETANLSAYYLEYFKHPIVERLQCNLTNPASAQKAFVGEHFDYIINLAAETRYGQDEPVYQEHIVGLATTVGKLAQDHRPELFIQFSTAQVYESSSKPQKETGKIKPWTNPAAYHKKAEEVLQGLRLPLIIVRPALIYGPADMTGLTPRLICAAVYTHLNQTMKFLWSKDLKVNTVHVNDVCAAVVHLCSKGHPGEIYNLADKNDTDQGKINQLLPILFRGLKTDFVGMKSKLAKVNFKATVDAVNEKHCQPWSEMCKAAGITNTPLSPFIDMEVLDDNDLCVDGSKIESTGFAYSCPKILPIYIKEIIDAFIIQGIFPQPKDYPKVTPIPPPSFTKE